MGKNILILNTSPRLNGNSHLLSAALACGATAAGHRVETLELGTAHIGPCLACDHCRHDGNDCIQQDDMPGLRQAIERADAVVWAAPLYYYGLPAQMKLVIDRFYVYDVTYPPCDSLLLMVCADDKQESFAAAVQNYQLALLDYMGWQDKGRLLVTGYHDAGEIIGDPALQQAYQMGLQLYA